MDKHLVSVLIKLRKDQVEIMDELEINRSKFFRDMVDNEYLNDNHLSEKKQSLEGQLKIVNEQIEKVQAKKQVEDVINDEEINIFKKINERFDKTPTVDFEAVTKRYWNEFCKDHNCHITLNTFRERFTRWNK